jgi:putative hydrolase of the HAD superfamily
MIQSVAFDLDGTLLNRSESIRHYCDFFLLEHLDWFDHDFDTSAIAERLYTLYREGMSKTPEYYESIIQEFQWNRTPSPEYLDSHYRQCMVTFCIPQDNIYTVMRALKSMGIRFGIVTNGIAQNQRKKIEHLNLHKVVDTILVSEEIGYSKPDAEVFELFCQQTRTRPEDTLFVGDDAMRDIWGAASTNLHTAWFADGRTWRHQDFKPDHIIEDLIEVIDYVQPVEGAVQSR